MVKLNIIPQVSKARNGVGAFVLPVSISLKKERKKRNIFVL